MEEDVRWLITDSNKNYLVKNEAGMFNVYNVVYAFNADREMYGNLVENCIFADFSGWCSFELGDDGTPGDPTGSQSFLDPLALYDGSPGFTFNYCCFYNNSMEFPTLIELGSNNTGVDPEFWDGDETYNISGDLNGTNLSTEVWNFDYDGDPRAASGPFDIGAQEYIAP